MITKDQLDVIVVGAGPAGLSAAAGASELGLRVLVLDDQPTLGGQLYRNIERADKDTLNILGSDYSNGLSLVEKFKNSGAGYQGSSIVWNIEQNGNVCFSHEGRSSQLRAKYVVIAIGAMERSVPFTGWTLPGVMGAGAVDANFKSSGTVPGGQVVLCGSGPLLLLVIGHLTALGVEIKAILDTTPKGNMMSALPLLPGALRRTDYLLKGVGMLLNLKRSGVKHYKNVTKYAAQGNEQLESVSFTAGGQNRQMDCDLLLVHEGVVPRCDFTQLLGLKHRWDPVQRYWYPETNQYGATSNDMIYVAGDGAFVHGGVPAVLKGSLAALDIGDKLRVLPASEKTDTIQKQEKELSAELAPRPFVDALYKPRPDLYRVADETVVCRCEEVTGDDIRKAIMEGCQEPNEIKALTRCGMGPCQGRMCGSGLEEIAAGELKIGPEDLHPLNIRAPVRNLPLVELSEISLLEDSEP